jgi:hypothetical protein
MKCIVIYSKDSGFKFFILDIYCEISNGNIFLIYHDMLRYNIMIY